MYYIGFFALNALYYLMVYKVGLKAANVHDLLWIAIAYGFAGSAAIGMMVFHMADEIGLTKRTIGQQAISYLSNFSVILYTLGCIAVGLYRIQF